MPLSRINLRQTATFVAVLALFDATLNVRYPGPEPAYWYFLPSVDVVILLCALTLLGSLERRVPRELRALVVAWFFCVRFLRIGDGLQEAYFGQPFHFASDLALGPELVRFVYSTLAWWKLVPAVLAGLAIVAGVAYGLYWGLRFTERYLAESQHALFAALLVLSAFGLTYAVGRPPRFRDLFWRGFAASSGQRLKDEVEFSFNIVSGRARFASLIDSTERKLNDHPHDLKKLAGRNVLLFVVESYGETVFRLPEYVEATRALYDDFEGQLTARGFNIATGVLSSSTYGGRSWLANATLSTGVRTSDQLEFSLVLAKKPKAIAKFFEAAGYHTVLAQPGTTRPWPKGEFYGFDRRYYAWSFDYAGPKFAWATMPDQYVLDFVHRKELQEARGPLFVEYVLVSSHAPWSVQPRRIADWAQLQDGAIYNRIKPVTYPIEWPKFENANGAYIRSIRYDFEILKEYLRDHVTDDSLVVILGDHQPVAEVNGHSPSRGVPVHVLCRDEALLAPFRARGYAPGMRPGPEREVAGLESFLPDFLVDFSAGSQGS